jgi:hypothetical protein
MDLINEDGRTFIGRMITKDESAVAVHTQETKQQSNQRLNKGVSGPVKSNVHCLITKIMKVAFFDSQVII